MESESRFAFTPAPLNGVTVALIFTLYSGAWV